MTEEQLEAVIEKMEEVVAAGVTITYEDYEKMPNEAKAALHLAREKEKAELAVMIATALGSQRGLAWVNAKVDGGDAYCDMEAELAVDRYFSEKA